MIAVKFIMKLAFWWMEKWGTMRRGSSPVTCLYHDAILNCFVLIKQDKTTGSPSWTDTTGCSCRMSPYIAFTAKRLQTMLKFWWSLQNHYHYLLNLCQYYWNNTYRFHTRGRSSHKRFCPFYRHPDHSVLRLKKVSHTELTVIYTYTLRSHGSVSQQIITHFLNLTQFYVQRFQPTQIISVGKKDWSM